jgi:hypothetical protein
MLSHTTARDWLILYADGMLASDERRRLDGHITGCAACVAELREIRALNLLLVTLPPAPPVAVAPFWLKLQAVLPQRRSLRIGRLLASRRLTLAVAMAAAMVVAAAGTAFAAPNALPDSPLYPVKQLEESVRLAIAPAPARLDLQLELASQRLYEARLMAANHKPRLAAGSLRAFQVIVNDAAAGMNRQADPAASADQFKRLRTGLEAVERENATKDDDDSELRQLVVASVDQLDRIEHPEAGTPSSTVIIGTLATPQPSAAPRPQPTPNSTPRPEPSDDDHRD